MSDPLSSAERYRSDAAKFSELAKEAPSPFVREYYEGLARRYLKHAENQEKIAKIADGSGDGRRQDDRTPDSPNVEAASRVVSLEEASASDQSSTPTPLQPAQGQLMPLGKVGAAIEPPDPRD